MSSSIRRTDLLALSNLRNDGRKPFEIRRLRIQMGAAANHTGVIGSALVEMGLTAVLATVQGPSELTARTASTTTDRAVLDVTVQTTPFCQAESSRRRGGNPNTDRRLLETAAQVQSALESCVLLQLYPNSCITIQICIVQEDGSRVSAAINAAMCAILDAGIPTKDICCACTAGYPTTASVSATTDAVLVDLNRREELGNGPGSVVLVPCAILPQRGTVVWTHCEAARLPDIDTLERVLEAAMEGCRAVLEHIQAAVRERAATVLAARDGNAIVVNALE